MMRAEADLVPEKAIPTSLPKATRYSPVRTSPSAMVMVIGPRPTPVRTKEACTGPRRCAASFRGKTSAVSEHDTKALKEMNIAAALSSGFALLRLIELADLSVIGFAFVVLTDASTYEVPLTEIERATQRGFIGGGRDNGSIATGG